MIKQQRQVSLTLRKKQPSPQSEVKKHVIKLSQQLTMKQIQTRKKLNTISNLDELQKIQTIIKKQNTQLKNDVAILKQHLVAVENSRRNAQQEKQNKMRNTIEMSKFRHSGFLSDSRFSTAILTQQQRDKYTPQMIGQWQSLQKQLHEQYKLMNLLKNNVFNMKNQLPTEEVVDQKLSRRNIISKLIKDIQVEKNQKLILQKQNKSLSQAIANQMNTSNATEEQIHQLQIENKQLRKQILSQKQQTYQHQTKAAKVIDSIYQKKQLLTQYSGSRQRRVDGIQAPLSGKLSDKRSNQIKNVKMSTYQISKQISPLAAISNYSTIQHDEQIRTKTISQQSNLQKSNNNKISTELANEISTLKNQVNQLSLASIKAKQTMKKQKSTLKDNNTKLNQNLILLQKNKTKKVNQLNHLKAKLKSILNQIQLQHLQKVKMICSSVQTAQQFDNTFNNRPNQQSYQYHQKLRKDFAGIIGHKNRFDDRLFLKDNYKSFIKGIIIYQNDNNLSIKGSLVAVRAIYTDQKANQINFVHLPGSYLQKCKVVRLQLPEDDFLKLMKVKYNIKQTRVTKIQIRSNRNLKYEFGDKKPFQQISQHQTVYAFDIGLNEFPVSLFGSYCLIKNCWYLQSIGVEINTLL